MLFFDLREPINALSHGAGMLLALPVTWLLWNQSRRPEAYELEATRRGHARYDHGKAVCLLIFGVTLVFCYGTSAVFHGVQLSGEPLRRLQRLDHVGIYMLIAGTYTPVAWALMRGSWVGGTLATVWTIAISCATRVWCGGVMPSWLSTAVYLTMGWGALFCYFKLAQTHSHRTLLPLPLGGVFYSVGAVLNLLRWPVLVPGVLAFHELLHFLVIAGSACHIFFMFTAVAPAREPMPKASHSGQTISTFEPVWEKALQRGTRWLSHLPSRQLRVKARSAVTVRQNKDDDLGPKTPDAAVGVS